MSYSTKCLSTNGRAPVSVNSLPNDKISDSSKLKQFAYDKINVNEKLKLLLGRVGNFVGKEENAGIAFSSFPTMYSKGFL